MKRVLLLTSRGSPAGHPYDETGPAIEEIVRREADMTVDLTVDRLRSPDGLAGFDAVVVHGHYGREWDRDRGETTDDLVQRLEAFVHRGGGLVVVHIASSSFEGSARYRRLAGRVWEYFYPGPPFTSDHPPVGRVAIDIVDPGHPVTAGMSGFELADDERYERLLVAPDAAIRDIAAATIAGRTEPVAWVVTPPQGGRVFHLTPGHGESTYRNPGFQQLLLRGIAWTAGEL